MLTRLFGPVIDACVAVVFACSAVFMTILTIAIFWRVLLAVGCIVMVLAVPALLLWRRWRW